MLTTPELHVYSSVCRKRRLVESYQLGRQIGSGGFGAVLNAVCKTTGKQVAIKKVHKNNVPKSYTVGYYFIFLIFPQFLQ